MLAFTLYRHNDDGTPTFGRLEDAERKQVCLTLELGWKDNAPDVSCIPPGVYHCAMRDSAKHHGQVYGVEGVPGRSDIEIHPANLASQLLGCIALGQTVGQVTLDSGETGWGVLNSKAAVAAFVALTQGQPFQLTIVAPIPLTNPQ